MTTDLIFGIKLMIENWEYRKELVMTFLDYKKASDSVRREEIWEKTRDFYRSFKKCNKYI
jgi:hypothetical protein